MVDEVVTPEPAVTASPTPPVVEAVPVVESAPAESTPAVVETPATPEAPATEAPVVEAAPEAAKPETLLASEKKPEPAAEVKPEEAKPAEEAPKPAEETAPVELPVFEAFTLPEHVTLEADKVSEFTKELAEFEVTTKVPHEEVQKLGQKMVDRYVAESRRFVESLTTAWEKQKQNDWDSFLKDPEFANRTDTVSAAALDAISIYGGTSEQQQQFRDLMRERGVGNHPAIIRLLSNVMLAKPEPKQLAAPQIAIPEKQSKISKMYGTKKA